MLAQCFYKSVKFAFPDNWATSLSYKNICKVSQSGAFEDIPTARQQVILTSPTLMAHHCIPLQAVAELNLHLAVHALCINHAHNNPGMWRRVGLLSIPSKQGSALQRKVLQRDGRRCVDSDLGSLGCCMRCCRRSRGSLKCGLQATIAVLEHANDPGAISSYHGTCNVDSTLC